MNYAFLGQAGVPSTGVLAVVLHISTINPNPTSSVNDGYVWAYTATSGSAPPTQINDPHPTSDTLANSGQGLIADNTVIVELDSLGQVSFYDGSQATSVNVFVDVEGYISDGSSSAGATYTPTSPSRVLNSTTLNSQTSTSVTVLGQGSLPAVSAVSSVAAVALNLTASSSSGSRCSVSATSSGGSVPAGAQKTQLAYGMISAQLVIVPTDSVGRVWLSTNCPTASATLDAEGYFVSAAGGATGSVYIPIDPQRIIDTRSNLGITGSFTPGEIIDGLSAVPVTGIANTDDNGPNPYIVPPTGVAAVALSLTTLNGSSGSVVVWPHGQSRPSAAAGVDISSDTPENNLIFAQPGSGGKIDLYSFGSTDLLGDIEGYFLTPSVPAAPIAVWAAPNSADPSQATVNWIPGTDGGSSLTGFSVWARPSSGSTGSSYNLLVPGTARSVTFNISPSAGYDFSVTSINSLGYGTASAPTRSDLASVTNLIVAPGDQVIDAEWQDPITLSSPVNYLALAVNGSGQVASGGLICPDICSDGGSTGMTYLSGLVNNASYTVQVQVVYSSGETGPIARQTGIAPQPDPQTPGTEAAMCAAPRTCTASQAIEAGASSSSLSSADFPLSGADPYSASNVSAETDATAVIATDDAELNADSASADDGSDTYVNYGAPATTESKNKRYHVSEPRQEHQPWADVVLVYVIFPDHNGKSGYGGLCTGSLVGIDLVATAAHCVYDRGLKEWADASRSFVEFQNERTSPIGGGCSADYFFTNNDWQNNGKSDSDMGAVKVKNCGDFGDARVKGSNPGSIYGYLGVWNYGGSGTCSHSCNSRFTGLPGKPLGNNAKMYTGFGDLSNHSSGTYKNSIHVVNGDSGGPFWPRSGSHRARYVVATESGDVCRLFFGCTNLAKKYNTGDVNLIIDWRAAAP